jgi:hypothetical protein
MLALRPAAVAVHDAGHMARQPRQVQAGKELRFFRGYRTERAWVDSRRIEMRFGQHGVFQRNSLYAAKLT